MEIILKQVVKNLGDVYDVVTVKPGYARNFLIPQGMAILATASNRKQVEEMKKQVAHKQEFVKKQATDLAEQLSALTLDIEVLAGKDGKIFGSVTNLQIANKLKEKGFDIDKKIVTHDEIHAIGEYSATVHLHREVKATVALNVKGKES
jgi:large subunit ribosomal protein L9